MIGPYIRKIMTEAGNVAEAMKTFAGGTDEELRAAILNLRKAGKDNAADWVETELEDRSEGEEPKDKKEGEGKSSVQEGYPDCPAAHRPRG